MLQINFILLELVYYFNRRDVEPKRQTFWVAEIILDYNINALKRKLFWSKLPALARVLKANSIV